MTFVCDGCKQTRPHTDLKRCVVDTQNCFYRYCRFCANGSAAVADVFWDGKPEENLADGPDGKPRVFGSKGEKAAYLKSRGLMEAGDRHHGAPMSFAKNQERRPHDSKHEAAMALKHVREMGKDVRRQEYFRVIREAQRHARS